MTTIDRATAAYLGLAIGDALRSPTCEHCADYLNCFGPED